MKKLGKKLLYLFPNAFKLMFRRVFLVSLSLLAQFAVLFFAIEAFREYYAWVYAFFAVICAVVVLAVINSRTNPAYQIAWLIPLLLFPVFGAMLYLILGGNKLSPRIKRRMQCMDRRLRSLEQAPDVQDSLREASPVAAVQSAYLTRCASAPVYQNTETIYFSSGEACFQRMLSELRGAEHYIFIEYFILAEGTMWGQILDILKDKAARGVDVRVVYDDFGSITRLPSRYYRKLEADGIQCAVFNPYIPILSSRLNNRDHRKLMIIDGVTAFTGGLNLADEYINVLTLHGHWKDGGILVHGDAAWSMTVMFLSMWEYLKGSRKSQLPQPVLTVEGGAGYVQPYTDCPLDSEDVGETVYRNLIGRALSHIYIMSPYLIMDNETIVSLTSAAKSGIDVRIITPAIPDKWYVHAVTRAYYEVLVEAGVRIFEYTPGFIHSKVFSVDGDFAAVGTINLDFRSLYLHFEDGVWLYRAACIPDIEADFAETFPLCHEITLAECRDIPQFRRLGRAFLRVFAPLL